MLRYTNLMAFESNSASASASVSISTQTSTFRKDMVLCVTYALCMLSTLVTGAFMGTILLLKKEEFSIIYSVIVYIATFLILCLMIIVPKYNRNKNKIGVGYDYDQEHQEMHQEMHQEIHHEIHQ